MIWHRVFIVAALLALGADVPTTGLDLVAHLNGNKTDYWLLRAIDGQLYFVHFREVEPQANDHVVEKFDRLREMCKISQRGSKYVITRLVGSEDRQESMKCDFTTDPPTVRWAEKADDNVWVFEPTERDYRYFVRSATGDAKDGWLSVGDPMQPRWVEKSGKRVSEIRPAVLRAAKRDDISASPRPTSK